jgi:hypothetical protein
MAVYCFKCRTCGQRWQTGDPDHLCSHPDMARDYQSEGVAPLTAGLKRMRDRGLDGLSAQKELRDLMLPTAEEMATPQDPTGQKGIRAWAERQVPKEGNKKPLYPEMEKQVF